MQYGEDRVGGERVDRLRPERHPGVWHSGRLLLLLLLLFLTFSALVANPRKLLYTVANPARGLLNREKKKKKKSLAASPRNHATHPYIEALRKSALRRWSRSVSHPYKDSYDSSSRPMGVASQNSALPCAIATFPVSLPLSSPDDVWPRLPLLASTRP